jgi:hypothetical protein
MSRGPLLDVPGTLHYMIILGIERGVFLPMMRIEMGFCVEAEVFY